jgi:hypothetical protein
MENATCTAEACTEYPSYRFVKTAETKYACGVCGTNYEGELPEPTET